MILYSLAGGKEKVKNSSLVPMENSTGLQTSSDQVCNSLPKPSMKKNLGKQTRVEETQEYSPSTVINKQKKELSSESSSKQSTYAAASTLNSPAMCPEEIQGPLDNRNYIRRPYVIDYQPDICKDYKQTGFCAYGLGCKLAHIREDDRKEISQVEVHVEDEKEDVDALPSQCSFCHRSFVDPVVTKCKHYFCLHCALKNYSTGNRCFVCKEAISGNFNTAHEIKKKMAADIKKKMAAEAK